MRRTLKSQDKLRRSSQFQETYAQARRLSGPLFTLFFKPNTLKTTRIGLSVSKKCFKLSTHRHYVQRRLREIYRLNKECLLPGFDIVVAARKFDKNKIGSKELKAEFLRLAGKAKILRNNA